MNGVHDALFSTLAKSVADGTKVTIPGWLAVEQTSRAARTGRNPQTGEPIEIAASKRQDQRRQQAQAAAE